VSLHPLLQQLKTSLLSLLSHVAEEFSILLRGCDLLPSTYSSVTDVLVRMIPLMAKNASIHQFCIAFVKNLHENKNILDCSLNVATSSSSDASAQDSFDQLVQQCLLASVVQWETGGLSKEDRISRVLQLVEICLMTRCMEPCRKLFVLVLKAPGDASDKFRTLYSPLIPRLRDLLCSKEIDICSSPFSDLLQLLIGSFLRDILGPKPRDVNMRNIGCGCGDCNLVDIFLNRNTSTKETFRYAKARRLHVEERLNTASDLISYTTIRRGTPHGVLVTKLPEVVTVSSWISHVAEAKELLKSIGDDAVISKLMGDRYDDVVKALQGTQPFILTVSDAVNVGRHISDAGSSQGMSPTMRFTCCTKSQHTADTIITGGKRKRSLDSSAREDIP
jgi:hypothetical protein